MAFRDKLKNLDDGSFDELVKQIEQKTQDKAEREKMLTETVLHNFMRACALNAQKDREATSESDHQVPEKLRNYMEIIQASEPVFVIEKRLTNSDLDDTQSRLSIPESKINAAQFLEKKEIETLNINRPLPVTMVEIGTDPVVETSLRMKKRRSVLVLIERWNEVKRRNEEKFRRADGVNAVIQLWSFRLNSRLYLALDVVEEEAKTGDTSTNGSTAGAASASSRSNGDVESSSSLKKIVEEEARTGVARANGSSNGGARTNGRNNGGASTSRSNGDDAGRSSLRRI